MRYEQWVEMVEVEVERRISIFKGMEVCAVCDIIHFVGSWDAKRIRKNEV